VRETTWRRSGRWPQKCLEKNFAPVLETASAAGSHSNWDEKACSIDDARGVATRGVATTARWIIPLTALALASGLTAIDIRRHRRGLPPSKLAAPLAFACGFAAAGALVVAFRSRSRLISTLVIESGTRRSAPSERSRKLLPDPWASSGTTARKRNGATVNQHSRRPTAPGSSRASAIQPHPRASRTPSRVSRTSSRTPGVAPFEHPALGEIAPHARKRPAVPFADLSQTPSSRRLFTGSSASSSKDSPSNSKIPRPHLSERLERGRSASAACSLAALGGTGRARRDHL
jgi:hypothetical protein